MAKEKPADEGYKKKLLQCKELRGEAGFTAYERARLLVDVFDDRDFRADLGNVDDWKAAKALDEYVEDLCIKFLGLRAMLEHFPRKDEWKEGKLATMYQQVVDGRSEPEQTTQERRRATLEDLERLEQQAKKWKEQADTLKGQLKGVQDELKQRDEKIAQLTRENDDLRAQLSRRAA